MKNNSDKMNSQISRLACLKTLEENKTPLDLLLETIESDCFQYNFDSVKTVSNEGKSITEILKENYSLEIEEYILEKLIQKKFKTEHGKLKLFSTEENLEEKQIRINKKQDDFLYKMSEIRKDFIKYARSEFKKNFNDEESKEIFKNYIYTVSKEKTVEKDNQYYFIFQKYLSHLYKEKRDYLAVVENFGIANQIQDLVLNDDIDDAFFLKDCEIFLDTPLIMKRLGYDGLEFSKTYEQFFSDLNKAGAELKIFEHTFEELWGILFNFKRCVAQNIFDAKGVNAFLKARKEFKEAKDEELSLDKESIRKKIKNELKIDFVDISVDDDIEGESDYSEWTLDTEKLEKLIIRTDENFQKNKSRLEKDVKSIENVRRLRVKDGIKDADSFKDGKYYLLVDNYALVTALKNYYSENEKNKKIKKNELMLENTIVFSLWQNLSNNDSLNRALFRSKCFALNTIDDAFKDKFYRETRRIEAYMSDSEIDKQLVANPDIEDEVYKKSIFEKKDLKKIEEDYLSNTIYNVIEDKNKERKEILENDKILKQDFLSEKAKNQLLSQSLADVKNKTEEILENQKKQNEIRNKQDIFAHDIDLIKKKVDALSKIIWLKILIFFRRKISRKFNKNEFLWKKACKDIGLHHQYSDEYFL